MGRKQDIREKLALLGVSPKKSHGQNFLFDPNGVQKVIDFAEVGPDDSICEIGPGLGAISFDLVQRAKRYVAIEIESSFAENLKNELIDFPSADVLCSDVRDVNLEELIPDGERWAVVSNVPYSVSSEVILWLLDQRKYLKSATLLFQREFAERVAAPPGGKVYGSLSVQCQLVADVKLGPRLGGTLFFPPASVESRLIRLDFLEQPRWQIDDPELFRAVVRAGFGKRRKTVLNSLLSAGLFSDKESGSNLLQNIAIDPQRRPETLSVREFADLSNSIARIERQEPR